MKIGIITVTHQSDEYRPYGIELVTNFIQSLVNISYDYECIVIDNASTTPIQYPNVHILRVDNQHIYGLTGGWELGLQKALQLDCDIIIINNDDLIYNNTINKFISYIADDIDNNITVYGPVSNGILSGVQLQNTPINSIYNLTNNIHNMINGFMFAFTKNFYLNFCKENGDLFDKDNYPWGGNEEEFQTRVWASGAKSIVIGNCWVEHKKIRGWKQFNKVV